MWLVLTVLLININNDIYLSCGSMCSLLVNYFDPMEMNYTYITRPRCQYCEFASCEELKTGIQLCLELLMSEWLWLVPCNQVLLGWYLFVWFSRAQYDFSFDFNPRTVRISIIHQAKFVSLLGVCIIKDVLKEGGKISVFLHTIFLLRRNQQSIFKLYSQGIEPVSWGFKLTFVTSSKNSQVRWTTF